VATLTAITTHTASYSVNNTQNTLHDVTSRLASPHLKTLIQYTVKKTPKLLRGISHCVYEQNLHISAERNHDIFYSEVNNDLMMAFFFRSNHVVIYELRVSWLCLTGIQTIRFTSTSKAASTHTHTEDMEA